MPGEGDPDPGLPVDTSNESVLTLLLEAGASPDVVAQGKVTLLMYMCTYGVNQNVIKTLVEGSIYTEARDDNDLTAPLLPRAA